MEQELFGRLVDWDTDAQTIRQLVRTCHRNAAPAGEGPSIDSLAAAKAVVDQHAVADGNGSVPVPPADGQTAEAVSEAVAAQTPVPDAEQVGDVDGVGFSSSSSPEEADGSQDAAAAATRPVDLASGEAAQSANRRRKAHSAAQRQLLDILRPLAQRALLEAQRPASVESVKEAEVFA